MKRTIPSFLLLFVFSMSGFAQVPNGDFESWSGNSPDGWSDTNIPAPGSHSPVSGVSGLACQGVVSEAEGVPFAFPPSLSTLLDGGATSFPVDQAYPTATFDYTFSSNGGDTFLFTISALDDNMEAVGVGAIQLEDAVSFTNVQIPIEYFGGTPTSMSIVLTVTGPEGSPTPTLGSTYVIDNIQLSNDPVGVEEEAIAAKLEITGIYPNPASEQITLDYFASQASPLFVRMLDLSGRVVLDKQLRSVVGEQQVQLSVSDFPEGLYLMQARLLGEMITKKVKVVH